MQKTHNTHNTHHTHKRGDAKGSVEADDYLARYQRAQHLNQGMYGPQVARNTTLFPVWIDGSNCFWYQRELEGGSEFRLVDAERQTNVSAFDHQALATALADATGETVDPYHLPINTPDFQATHILDLRLDPLRLKFQAFDRDWEFDVDTAQLKAAEPVENAWVISPDGSQAAFRREHDIWLRDLASGQERALTQDGEPFFRYGIPGSVWGNDGLLSVLPLQARWSPDGRLLFTVQLDQRQVKTLGEIQHVPLDGTLRPVTRQRKLAFAGDEHIEEYRLVIIEVSSGRSIDVNYGRVPITLGAMGGFFDNALAWWAADSTRAYFVDLDRYQKCARVLEVDSRSGAVRLLFEEHSNTHIDLLDNPLGSARLMPLPESRELLWVSERSGWAHVYLYDLDSGELKNAVTSGEWLVRDELIHFDAERRTLFLSTAGREPGRNPYYCDLVRVNVDSGELTVLASSDHDIVTQSVAGWAQLFKGYAGRSSGVAPTGDYALVTRSRVDAVSESILVDRNGQPCLAIEKADYSLPQGWQWPQAVRMKAADGSTDLYGVVYRPSNFNPQQRYPVIDLSYIGHILSGVARSSFRTGAESSYASAASLAELGFIVVQLDGRGSGGRNKAFKDHCYGWKDSGCDIDDHVAGIKQLAEQIPAMDLDRVGIAGFVGGNGALLGLLKHPDFYKVGVACELFDFRVMRANAGDVQQGPHAEDDQQNLEDQVEHLQGKLLLTIGLLDYVPPAVSFRVVEALQRANKDFDLIVEPCSGYGFTPYQLRRAWDFLVRHLQGAEPPKAFSLAPLSQPIVPKEFAKLSKL